MKKFLLLLFVLVATCGLAKAQECLYLVGTNTDWAEPNNVEIYKNWRLEKVSDGIYEGTFEINNDSFHFRIYDKLEGWGNGSMGPQANDDQPSFETENKLVWTNDNAWMILNKKGKYIKFTVDYRDLGNLKMTLAEVEAPVSYPKLYVRGEMGGEEWPAADAWELKTTDGVIYTLTGKTLYEGTLFKIADADWSDTYDFGSPNKDEYLSVVNGESVELYKGTASGDLQMASTVYNAEITFNLEERLLTVSGDDTQDLVADEKVVAYFVAPEGVVPHIHVWSNESGVFTEWENDPAMEVAEGLTYNGMQVYKHELDEKFQKAFVLFHVGDRKWNDGPSVEINGCSMIMTGNDENNHTANVASWQPFRTPAVVFKADHEFGAITDGCGVVATVKGGTAVFKYGTMSEFTGDYSKKCTIALHPDFFNQENTITTVSYKVRNTAGVDFPVKTAEEEYIVYAKPVYVYVAHEEGVTPEINLSVISNRNSAHSAIVTADNLEATGHHFEHKLDAQWSSLYVVDQYVVAAHLVYSTVANTTAAFRSDALANENEDALRTLDGNNNVLYVVPTNGESYFADANDVIPSGTDISGIADVAVDAAAPVEFYNMQGVRVEGELIPGVYVRRQGNSTSKVVVK